MTPSTQARVASWLAVLLLTGCASSIGGSAGGLVEGPLGQPGSPAQGDAVASWRDELAGWEADQNWAERLTAARRGVSEFQRPAGLRISVIMLALDALSDYVDLYDATPELDDEAGTYHAEAQRLAVGVSKAHYDSDWLSWLRAELEQRVAIYFSNSGRNGLAIPHLLRNLDYWAKSSDPDDRYSLLMSHDAVASAYGDMGELALERHHRDEALKIARRYFVLGLRPASGQPWINYAGLLKKKMDDIAEPGRAQEILDLWKIARPIYHTHLTYVHSGYAAVANYLAIAGDFENAERFMTRAIEESEKVARRKPQVAALIRRDVLCSRASVRLRAGRFTEAAALFEDCLRQTPGSAGASLHRLMAEAYEGLGELDRAIESYRLSIDSIEKTRSSYSVAQRATFFRSVSRRSYWGLIRCYAKRAASGKNRQDFLAALQASELIRGRQLGELVDPETEPMLALERLGELMGTLEPHAVVLDYIVTEREIVVLAFSRERWLARVVPHDASGFRLQMKQLANDLASPDSQRDELERRLVEVSRTLIDPVSSLLRAQPTIIVLPDGAMNLIPFDLLSEPEARGRPLIERRTIRVAASLRLMFRDRAEPARSPTNSLFALADPRYRETYQVGALSDSALRAVSRGNSYLNYFTPLPETRSEVLAIAKLFDEQNVDMVLGQQASESRVKAADLRSFQFVHMATHGILGGELPGVSEPALVLSEEPGQDGFLTASEASALRLNSDLTILSACKTGSGEFVTGEGVMGMSRAFLVAGSRNVLVSLWSVDSKATEALMVAFYQYLRSGTEPPDALRKAKLDLMREAGSAGGAARGLRVKGDRARSSDRRHPFYWAAFILVGG